MKRQRSAAIILLLVMAVVLVSGCAPTDAQYKIDPKNAGWWDKLLVLPLSGLLDGFKDFLGNFGLSILAMTFLVRLAVFPLTWKQQKSAEAMKQIQPQVAKIREKYKNNPQKMQEETMKLFQKEGVNPMAGCLPMLVQLPILIAFYQAIMYNPHIRTSEFLWLQLGHADPYFILPLLAAVTTYIQLIATGSADNPQMKVMLWIMPVMIFVLAYQFPAALSLYWVYSNIFTILQYLIFFRKKKDKLAEGAAR